MPGEVWLYLGSSGYIRLDHVRTGEIRFFSLIQVILG
jgi:hypothetical protein